MNRWLKSGLSVIRTLAAVLCVIAFFAIVDFAMHGNDATFWSVQNLQSISVQNAFVAICSLGMLLVIISGGIDLSAGVALALCTCVLALGMREDVGFMLAHGENVAGAVTRLKLSDNALQDAQANHETATIEKLQHEVDASKKRLAELLKIKSEQLGSSIDSFQANEVAPKQQLETLEGQLQKPTEIGDREKSSLQAKIAKIKSTVEELESHTQQYAKYKTAVDGAIANLEQPNSTIDADPTWLHSLPNASSSAWIAILMGVGSGLLCGLLNGILIVTLHLVPFIATLGTMCVFLGLALIVADETSVRPSDLQFPQWLSSLMAVRPDPSWLIVSKGVWFALILAGVMGCILRYTVFGRYVFALGSNESTARLCGINVPLVKIAVYSLAGLLTGIASVCFFAKLNTGNPTAGTGMELKFIAAVVIGGGSLSGGRGTVLGTLAGTAIMGVIASGGTLLGLKNPMQYIVLGIIIIAAVAIDQLRQHRD